MSSAVAFHLAIQPRGRTSPHGMSTRTTNGTWTTWVSRLILCLGFRGVTRSFQALMSPGCTLGTSFPLSAGTTKTSCSSQWTTTTRGPPNSGTGCPRATESSSRGPTNARCPSPSSKTPTSSSTSPPWSTQPFYNRMESSSIRHFNNQENL